VFRDVVLLRIEKVIENVVKSLSCDSSPTVVVANTGTWNNVRYVTVYLCSYCMNLFSLTKIGVHYKKL